jgi:SIR2-like domain
MPLDPIVSLSVAIAEAPGSYAFFLGSGVSRDAGVPTGGEVFWRAVGELYRLENTTSETLDDDRLRDWLEHTGRTDLGYSDILELITPDQATRRDYLAKHFEGIEPGPTHERLADLAARGLIGVFVTTNFDRLLERALQARGIEPIVVTSDADLAVAPVREHARCYVLKPHGDYLQQTIRNTSAELAELEPAMTAELAEVFSRYGLVVLGYSGADPAIAEAMRGRRSRYGVYWVARTELSEPAGSLVEALAGRVVERADAATFLIDLARRIAVFEAQPSGQTPLAVHDEVVVMLRRGDRVGLAELLRAERREFEENMSALSEGRHKEQPNKDIALACHAELLPVFERRLASLLPLIIYDSQLFEAEVAALADYKGRQPVLDGYKFWPDLIAWSTWWLGLTIGAFAVREGRYAALPPLFDAETPNLYSSGSEPLVGSEAGEAGHYIGHMLMKQVRDESYWEPAWMALQRDLPQLELLRERYPELVSSEDETRRSLVEFDFIHNIALGLRDERAVSNWTMFESAATGFARRLHSSARLRERVAEAVGVSLADFDADAPEALRAAHKLGPSPDHDAIRVLETGSRR